MPALLSRRMYAFGVDVFVAVLAGKALMLCYILFVGKYLQAFGPLSHQKLFNHLDAIHFFVLHLVFWSYRALCLYAGGGRTLGKLALGLRVRSRKRDHPRLWMEECFLRAFGHLLCLMGGMLPYLLVFFNKEGLGLPDLVSGSRVEQLSDEPAEEEESDDSLPLAA